MKKLTKYFAPHFYPQNVFGKAICAELKNKDNINIIIDAPCGNGETTFHISKKIIHAEVFGYDISPECIQNAKRNFQRTNLKFAVSDIFNIFENHKRCDVFCVVNSLFLLPNPDLLLQSIYKILPSDGWLIVIVPNIEGANYKSFLSTEANRNINRFVLNKNEFNSFFLKYGFKVKTEKGIVFAKIYGRVITKYLSVFSHFYLSFLNAIYSIFKLNSPNYFLLTLTKI